MASHFHTIVDDRSSDGEESSLLEKAADPKTMAAFRTVGGKYCFQDALVKAKKISEVKKKYEGKLEYGNTTRKNSTNISTFVTIGLIIILLSSTFVEGVEWNCSATSGTFTQTTDCNMTDQVILSGNLSITGKENTYTTLFAASQTHCISRLEAEQSDNRYKNTNRHILLLQNRCVFVFASHVEISFEYQTFQA